MNDQTKDTVVDRVDSHLNGSSLASFFGQSNEHLAELRGIIREALKRRRQAVVFQLATKVYERFLVHEDAIDMVNVNQTSGWVQIESLSQLRSVVGGRFQNLKRKWIEAGFPLREHRGDRGGPIQVDSQGWVELSVWINEQGYEVRLADESASWLFEVKKSDYD